LREEGDIGEEDEQEDAVGVRMEGGAKFVYYGVSCHFLRGVNRR